MMTSTNRHTPQNFETALVRASQSDLFRPVDASDRQRIEELLEEHARLRDQIHAVAQVMADKTVFEFFVTGNTEEYVRQTLDGDELFAAEGALSALDAEFWDRVLRLTDVLDCMPQERRDQWYEDIRERKTPPFEWETVASTMIDLLTSRERFFAERVDAIFRSLSRTHVTNTPKGFRARMIIADVVDPRWGSAELSPAGKINDLRAVIARFMNRGEIPYNSTGHVIDHLYRAHTGKWVALDGGAVRMRVYKKGTVHLEVHDDMAWRLNQMLAKLHPQAIPEEHRKRPPLTRAKKHVLYERPLPFPVLSMLSEMVRTRMVEDGTEVYAFPWNADKNVSAEVRVVLEALGGVRNPAAPVIGVVFDFAVRSVIEDVVATGTIPDPKAHQYYPTPPDIAEIVTELAEIEPHHRVLEPSAGTGNLVASLDPKQVTCVEISERHCQVLRARGIEDVIRADFLDPTGWMIRPSRFYDRVIMNPPFSAGRWKAHLKAAIQYVRPAGGRLVAVLPASAEPESMVDGKEWEVLVTTPMPFPGTRIKVIIAAIVAK